MIWGPSEAERIEGGPPAASVITCRDDDFFQAYCDVCCTRRTEGYGQGLFLHNLEMDTVSRVEDEKSRTY